MDEVQTKSSLRRTPHILHLEDGCVRGDIGLGDERDGEDVDADRAGQLRAGFLARKALMSVKSCVSADVYGMIRAEVKMVDSLGQDQAGQNLRVVDVVLEGEHAGDVV